MATILIVDDRAINREFLVTLLGYAGHRAIEAADGAAALDMACRMPPDLVISDIVMPTMDGVEFVHCLRADAAIAHIPVIFYTASYRLPKAGSLAQSCGVTTVLSKPSKPQVILDAVAAALGVHAVPAVKQPALKEPLSHAGPSLDLSLRLSMLIELDLELSAQSDPQQLFDLACRATQEIFSADYAAIGAVDAGGGELRHVAMHGFAGAAGNCFASLDARAGLLYTVQKEGKPCRLPGLAGNMAVSGLPTGHPPIGSLLAAPLTTAACSYGWLYVANGPGGDSFGAADEQIAMAVAVKLALAYENLLLYDSQRHYTARLEADAEAIKQLNAGLTRQIRAREVSESRFRLAMEVGTSVAFTLDLDLRYTWIHSCRVGFDEQAVLGKTDFDLFDEDTAKRLTALYAQVIATGVGLRRDVNARSLARSDAQDFELIVEPLRSASGEVIGIICAAAEITERKRAEAALRQAMNDAERANNSKSRFLAAASHDLRQPLAALSIYVDVVKSHVAASGQALLANMKGCVGSLSRLLNDLLDVSKLDAGVVKPNSCHFSFAATLAALESIHGPEAQSKGLRLRCVCSSVTVHTDPILFRRILGNFIENAIRYTDRGGVLVVCRRRRGKTWVEVWDSGVGIAADKTAEIFEEFKQLGDDARTRGSGLGLAIVAKSAALLGLEISVRSRLGRGSVFAIELPPGQEDSICAPAPRSLPSRALRIALVEDNAVVREAMVHALTDASHHVVAAATGKELCLGLGNLAPDIIVSDYRLTQGETGFDVISMVRATLGAALPAVLITGDTDPKLMRSMADRGIIVLHKPVDIETLQAHLEDLTYQDGIGMTH